MIFTGEYEHTIDAKYRLAIPAEIRNGLEEAKLAPVFYLVPGANGFLWLWPEKTFQAMSDAMTQSLLPPDEMMELEEFVYSQSSRLEIDKSGRVRLPEKQIREAELSSSITILGIRDHLELRDTEEWNQKQARTRTRRAEIMLKGRRALEEQQRSTLE